MKCIAQIEITPEQVVLNGQPLSCTATGDERLTGRALLTALYKERVGDYPKFYKMDPLARLGFLAAELLLQSLGEPIGEEREDRAIVLVNRSASLAADNRYEATIQPGPDYFPSPADFVYTLPNIVTGEIAIRHHYHGETTFLVLPEADEATLQMLYAQALADGLCRSVLGGWVECQDAEQFAAHLQLLVAPSDTRFRR